ncbi:MAG: sugar ABC transporter permease [Bacilli bacterium]|nr:sugar ABC transporter permease [Bacilli bacterium]
MVRAVKYKKSGGSASKKKIKDAIAGWIFIAPLLIGMLLFLAFPLGYAFVISFTDAKSTMDGASFVGFDNYVTAFKEPLFMQGLINVLITCIAVPIAIFIAVILTNLLVANPRGSTIFKAIFYIPTICGAIAISFIWQSMYAQGYGVINQMLKALGWITTDINFISDKNFLVSMMVMGVWAGLGTSILLLYASLKSVNRQLYEAASVDGANFVQKFRYITLPALSPTIFYILVTGISGTLQEFSRFQAMAGAHGTPAWAMSPVWFIYIRTANNFRGQATACGIILGACILIISAFQFVGSRLWVNYDS